MDSVEGKTLSGNSDSDDGVMEDLTPKKVRFRDKEDGSINERMLDGMITPSSSWKDKLLGHPSKSVGFKRRKMRLKTLICRRRMF